jgi:hypothetical protein
MNQRKLDSRRMNVEHSYLDQIGGKSTVVVRSYSQNKKITLVMADWEMATLSMLLKETARKRIEQLERTIEMLSGV